MDLGDDYAGASCRLGTIWQERAERARSRAVGVTHKYSKRRMLKLAKRYEQMANLSERAAKKDLDPQ